MHMRGSRFSLSVLCSGSPKAWRRRSIDLSTRRVKLSGPIVESFGDFWFSQFPMGCSADAQLTVTLWQVLFSAVSRTNAREKA